MVLLAHVLHVGEFEFGDEGPPPQLSLVVEIRDVAHHQVIGHVEGDRVALLDKGLEIRVMTDQIPKH